MRIRRCGTDSSLMLLSFARDDIIDYGLRDRDDEEEEGTDR